MSFRSIILLTASLTILAGQVAAQEQPADDDRVLDTVVVQGSQLSRLKGIAEKRDALSVIDALGVDELGQLPDNNVGESLNRIAGV